MSVTQTSYKISHESSNDDLKAIFDEEFEATDFADLDINATFGVTDGCTSSCICPVI